MNKKIIAIGTALTALMLGLGTYYYKASNRYYKPSEIIQEAKKERELNKDRRNIVEWQIDLYNRYIEYKSKEALRRVFFDDCSISKHSQDIYLDEFLSQTNDNPLEFNFLHYYPDRELKYKIGVSVNEIPQFLVGTTISDLHLQCNYFEDKLTINYGNGSYCVQLASFLDENEASKFKNSLDEADFKTYIGKREVNGQLWTSVRLGYFKNKKDAENAREAIDGMFNIKNRLYVRNSV